MKAIEATTTTRGASGSRTLVGALLMAVALGVGAAGGYVAASLAPDKAHNNNTEVVPATTTVAQPAELPGYIVQEISPAPTPRLSQDSPEFIAKYAAPADTTLRQGQYASLPDWVVREITTQQGQRLSQDSPEFISRYAAP